MINMFDFVQIKIKMTKSKIEVQIAMSILNKWFV